MQPTQDILPSSKETPWCAAHWAEVRADPAINGTIASLLLIRVFFEDPVVAEELRPSGLAPSVEWQRRVLRRHTPICCYLGPERLAAIHAHARVGDRLPATVDPHVADARGPRGARGAFAPRWNYYRCLACGAYLVTVDVAPGTTPAFVACSTGRCPGAMASGWYPRPTEWPPEVPKVADAEWYMPNLVDRSRMKKKYPALYSHVLAGGLIMRKATAETPRFPEPSDAAPSTPADA